MRKSHSRGSNCFSGHIMQYFLDGAAGNRSLYTDHKDVSEAGNVGRVLSCRGISQTGVDQRCIVMGGWQYGGKLSEKS